MEMMNVMRLWVPAWQRGPLCSRKWSINSLWPRAGLPQGAPNVRSQHIDHIFRQSWSTWVSSFGKHLGNPWQLGFCDFGTQGWARHLWRFASLYREKLRDSTWDAILEVWRPDRGPEPVKAPSGDRRKCGVTCVVSYDVDLVEQCTKKAALWCRQRTVKPVSLDLEKCKHVGELWMPQKSPSWRGRPRACEGFWGSIIKTPQEWSFPCWGFPAISQGQMADWTWPWKIKALHMQWAALLALWGQGLQHEFHMIPSTGFCCVLGMELFGRVCCSYCCCKI